ncbi:MAG TPA: helicase-exonuclease AddAB subunit AddB, partial [Clostridiaceae bacterium]|nr:helicase-exonuclease AddAB subunit AddB [Clostridiaceae bacterium]
QADHEVAFQKGGKYPPISICLPSGEEIKLVGRIDRVDMLKGEEGIYVRIIDYKSGNKDFNLSDIYNGLEFQLLIYIDAILEQVSKTTGKPAFPGGILYFKIDEPIVSAEGELTEEEAEKEIMKRLKMRGLLLSDVRVVKEMDRNIKGYSLIIPANIRADGNFGPNSSIASAQDFEALRKHVKNCIIDLCEEMLKGNISIHPYKKRNMTPCSFCSFKPVCGFDTSVSENTYRIIDDKSKDEVWSALSHESKAEGGNGSGMDE